MTRPIPFEGAHTPEQLDLYGPYTRLVPIVVCGLPAHVPEGNTVLRVLQYLEIEAQMVRMPWRDYCWNDSDGCCLMRYRRAPGAQETNGRACRVHAVAGLEITRLPKGGRLCPPTS